MTPPIATILCVIAIVGLCFLDREKDSKTSWALWIPITWMAIIGSRPVAQWLSPEAPADSAAQLLDGSPIDRNVYSVLLLLALIVLISRGQRVFGVLRRNGPILLFYAYCLVSVLWSDYPDVAIKRWIKDLGDLLMVLVILTDSEPLTALKRILTRVGLTLVMLSILFIKYYPDLGRAYSPWTGETSYTGVTTNKQGLGMVILIFGPGAVWQLVHLYRAKGTPHRWRPLLAQGVLLAEVIWLLSMAHSLTSTACFLMVSCLIAAIGLYKTCQKPAFVHLYVTSATSLVILALFLSPGSGLVESMGRNSTLTGRTEIWNLVLNMPVNRFIGTGFESFWLGRRLQEIWGLYWWHPNEAHNGYIEVLINLGWIGMILLAFMLLNGYRNITSDMRRDPEANSIRLGYLLVGVVYAFTEAAFRMLTFTWIFLLYATAASAETPIPEAVQPRLRPVLPPLKSQRAPAIDHLPQVGRRRGAF
jgi:exopolysaccharide production protein ExoQ